MSDDDIAERNEEVNELRNLRVLMVEATMWDFFRDVFKPMGFECVENLRAFFIDSESNKDYVDEDATRTHNVGNAVSFIEQFTKTVLTARLAACEHEGEAYYDEGMPRYHFYCTSHGESDDVTFDSISDAEHLDIRTIDPYRDTIYKLLWDRPLFEALGMKSGRPILDEVVANKGHTLPGRKAEPKRFLDVIIVGCGKYGFEALKAAMWSGQIPRTRLVIHVIDQMPSKQFMSHLRRMCPGIFVGPEAPHTKVSGHLLNVGSLRLTVSVEDLVDLRYYQSDAEDQSFITTLRDIRNDIIARGTSSPVYGYGLPETLDQKPYCIVALGNDDLNVDTAITIRRVFAGTGTRTIVDPILCLDVADPRMHRVVGQLQSQGKRERNGFLRTYDFIPFGALGSIYDISWITEADVSLLALNVNLAFDIELGMQKKNLTYDDRERNFRHFSSCQVSRLSNVAAACSIRTKLWLFGYDCARRNSPKAKGKTDVSEVLQTELERLEGAWEQASNIHVPQFPDELAGSSKETPDLRGCTSDDALRFDLLLRNEHSRWEAFYLGEGWVSVDAKESSRLPILGFADSNRHDSHLLRLHPFIADYDHLGKIAEGLKSYRRNPYVNDALIVGCLAKILTDARDATDVKFSVFHIR